MRLILGLYTKASPTLDESGSYRYSGVKTSASADLWSYSPPVSTRDGPRAELSHCSNWLMGRVFVVIVFTWSVKARAPRKQDAALSSSVTFRG